MEFIAVAGSDKKGPGLQFPWKIGLLPFCEPEYAPTRTRLGRIQTWQAGSAGSSFRDHHPINCLLTTRQRGDHWEQVAESFLNQKGLKTLQKNYLVKCGEIDLVMLDESVLVFIEVRYRVSDSHGSGADSVTWTKQKRITNAARRYLQCHPALSTRTCRFDVVSIGSREGRTLLNWIQNAFDAT